MARSQQSLTCRVRNGLIWRLVQWEPGSAVRDRYVYSDGFSTVEVFPPVSDIRSWLVVVDGIEVLDLSGPRAESLAFAAADAFAYQADSLNDVLREQGYIKRPRTKRRARRP